MTHEAFPYDSLVEFATLPALNGKAMLVRGTTALQGIVSESNVRGTIIE